MADTPLYLGPDGPDLTEGPSGGVVELPVEVDST